MIEALAESGVALVFLSNLRGLRLGSLTKWLSPRKAMILLSRRRRTAPDMWFTFFHQAGHLLLHSRKQVFVERSVVALPPRGDVFVELEADRFAAEFLVPARSLGELRRDCEAGGLAGEALRRFAAEQGIAPEIVAARIRGLGWAMGQAAPIRSGRQ